MCCRPPAATSQPLAGQRSFLEGVLLPDFGSLVADTLAASGSGASAAAAAGGPKAADGSASAAYFDADYMFGSLRDSFSNTVQLLLSLASSRKFRCSHPFYAVQP